MSLVNGIELYHVLPCYYERLLAKTADLNAEEFGAYWRLLLHQWQKGAVPIGKPKKLSQIMGCPAGRVMSELAGFFQRQADGRWQNRRLEEVRVEQAAIIARNSTNGAKGGRPPKPRRNPNQNPNETQPVSEAQPKADPKVNPNESLLDPSTQIRTSKEPDPTTSTPSDVTSPSSSPLLTSPLQFEKAKKSFAFYGSRLKVPHVLHGELRDKLGGDNPEAALQAWYLALNTEAEETRAPIVDVFKFVRPKFAEWAAEAVASAELARFRPKGA